MSTPATLRRATYRGVTSIADDAPADLERLSWSTTAARRPAGGVATAGQRLAGVALLFVVWEIAARAGWLNERTLRAPSTVADVGWDMVRDGTLPAALRASGRRVLLALAIGTPAGAALALIAGLSRAGDAVVDANLQVLRYVPILSLQPLLIVWLGVGEASKVALLAVGAAFPIYINTHAAIRAIHVHYHELADVLSLSSWQRIRRVVIPGSIGGFLIGLRYASAVTWLLLIVAEQINARDGLGRLMANAQAFLKTDVIVVIIVVYTALGVASDLLIRAAERYLLRWQARR